MLDLALAAVVFALLFGRGFLVRLAGRSGAVLLSLAAAAGALTAAARGSWVGAGLLVGAALWVGAAARSPMQTRSSATAMSRAEALAMLGLGADAGRDEVEAAYRRLMRRVHPDAGGAPGLAAQLNRARETLRRAKP